MPAPAAAEHPCTHGARQQPHQHLELYPAIQPLPRSSGGLQVVGGGKRQQGGQAQQHDDAEAVLANGPVDGGKFGVCRRILKDPIPRHIPANRGLKRGDRSDCPGRPGPAGLCQSSTSTVPQQHFRRCCRQQRASNPGSGFCSAVHCSATHRAMRNAPVQAIVAATDTTAVPAPTPKIAPAVMVSGMAGTASSSSPAYTAMYAT